MTEMNRENQRDKAQEKQGKKEEWQKRKKRCLQKRLRGQTKRKKSALALVE